MSTMRVCEIRFAACPPGNFNANLPQRAMSSRCGRLASSASTAHGAWNLYTASLYWATATVTSIGYGDISASPGALPPSPTPTRASAHLAAN
eukprot:1427187-Pleurochrysis_carterae.AAC.2